MALYYRDMSGLVVGVKQRRSGLWLRLSRERCPVTWDKSYYRE
jgi:hypothetical protein